MNFIISCAVLILTATHVELYSKKSVTDAFKKAEITPAIIPEPPNKLLKAKYEKAWVNLGNYIFPTKTIGIPYLEYQTEPRCLYTLIITDPDVYSAEMPTLRSCLLALYVNLIDLDLGTGCILASYLPANPIPGSGLNRFILLLYKQTDLIETSDPALTQYEVNRCGFSVTEFAANYSLCLEAGNFFYSDLSEDLVCKL